MTPRSKIVLAAVLFLTGPAALAGGALILGATVLRSLADARAPALA